VQSNAVHFLELCSRQRLQGDDFDVVATLGQHIRHMKRD